MNDFSYDAFALLHDIAVMVSSTFAAYIMIALLLIVYNKEKPAHAIFWLFWPLIEKMKEKKATAKSNSPFAILERNIGGVLHTEFADLKQAIRDLNPNNLKQDNQSGPANPPAAPVVKDSRIPQAQA